MGSKVVTIKPKMGGLIDAYFLEPEELQVIFTWSKARLGNGYQTVTNCVLRHGLHGIGVGFAIENPLDESNIDEGKRWAFKRAIQSLINRIEHINKITVSPGMRQFIDRGFRQALWEATNEQE